jgi:hypothetical protein
MATKGLKHTYMGIKDGAGKGIKATELGPDGIYHSSKAKDDYGTKMANVQNIGSKGTPKYGDNGLQYTVNANSYPEVALEFLNMPFEAKMTLLGWEKDENGGYSKGSEDAHVALIVETEGLTTGTSLYYAFQNGELIETNKNIATNETAETVADDVFTYSSLKPFSDDWAHGMKVYDGGDKNFNKDKMFAEVFGLDIPSTVKATTK